MLTDHKIVATFYFECLSSQVKKMWAKVTMHNKDVKYMPHLKSRSSLFASSALLIISTVTHALAGAH